MITNFAEPFLKEWNPPISPRDRIKLEDCAVYFDKIAEAHKMRGVINGDQLADHWHWQASEIRRKLAHAATY